MTSFCPNSFTPSTALMVIQKWDSERTIQLRNLYIRSGCMLCARSRHSIGTYVTAKVFSIHPMAYTHGFRELKFTHRVEERVITFCFKNFKISNDGMVPLSVDDPVAVEVIRIG